MREHSFSATNTKSAAKPYHGQADIHISFYDLVVSTASPEGVLRKRSRSVPLRQSTRGTPIGTLLRRLNCSNACFFVKMCSTVIVYKRTKFGTCDVRAKCMHLLTMFAPPPLEEEDSRIETAEDVETKESSSIRSSSDRAISLPICQLAQQIHTVSSGMMFQLRHKLKTSRALSIF